MKSTQVLKLLLIFSAVSSLSFAYDCAGFMDGTTCVKNCVPPMVGDVQSGNCLQDASLCLGAFYLPDNVCLPQCPPHTMFGVNADLKQICLPIDLLLQFPNAASLQCSTTQYIDIVNNICTLKTTACSGYLIPEVSVCFDACPPGFESSTMVDGDGNTVNICVLRPFHPPAECLSSEIRDEVTNTCLASVDNCVGFLMVSKRLCVERCPLGSGEPQAVANASYSICTQATLNCTANQVSDVVHSVCVDNVSDCTGFYIQDVKVCADVCPDNNQVADVDGQTYKVCVPCMFKDAQGVCYAQCPPTLRPDNIKRICVEDLTLSCTKFYVKSTNTCEDSCPFGTITNTSTTPKSCVPCAQTSAGCPNQSNLCDLRLSEDKTMCAPECPNLQYALPQASGVKYRQCKSCTSTAQFVNVDGTACVDKCGTNEVGDRATRRCMDISHCTMYVFTENGIQQCGRQCPKNQIAAAAPANGATFIQCSGCPDGQFLDLQTDSCVASCSVYDATHTSCLESIFDCVGYISSDALTCNSSCAANQVHFDGNVSGQFICSDTCPSSTFLQNGQCRQTCLKGSFPDQTTQTCVDVSKCTLFVSINGKECVEKCGPGQFVQTDDKSSAKICKACFGKVSADGTKCLKECLSTEVFDDDLKQCLDASASATCSDKIFSPDGKSCSNSCSKGQLLKVDLSGNRSCLTTPQQCTDIVSSDLANCVTSCQSNEAVITKNGQSFCRVCPFGPTADKSDCSSASKCDASTQLFDLDLGECVAIADCSTKLLSVDGLKCSSNCVFPEVTRIAVSSTQCYAQCGDSEIRVRDKGCVSAAECTGYISEGSGNCVDECIQVREEIDSTSSTPKTCKQCDPSTQIPVVVDSAGVRVIQCQDKSDNDSQLLLDGMVEIMGSFSTIYPEQKSDVKDQMTTVSTSIDAAITAIKSNLELTDEEKRAAIKTYMDSVRGMARSYSKKVVQSSASSEDAPDSQLIISSTEFQIMSEQLKTGNVFNASFSLDEFLSSSPPSLQVDPSTLASAALLSSGVSDINTLEATNQSTNPYCADATKCSSYGLFQLEYVLADGTRRSLTESDGKTFTTVYKVSADAINKTVCVSYDVDSGDMSLAVSTSTDTTASTVTCTFYSNSDLYLDSSCQYIDSSNCSSATETSSSVSSSGMNVFSLSLLAVMLVAMLI